MGSRTVSGTRVHQARVPLCTGHLFFLNITPYSLNFLKPSLPTIPQLLSHHSLSQSPSHSLNFAINSLWLSQSRYQTLPRALNLPFSLALALILHLPLTLGLPLALLLSLPFALLLGLPLALLLMLLVSLSQGMSRSACIFSLSIGYLWVFVVK